jgi:hypothetical protein
MFYVKKERQIRETKIQMISSTTVGNGAPQGMLMTEEEELF